MKCAGSICGSGMCPYIPCEDFPGCGHVEVQLKFEKRFGVEK